MDLKKNRNPIIFYGPFDRADMFLLCCGIDESRLSCICNRDHRLWEKHYKYILNGTKNISVYDVTDIDRQLAETSVWVIAVTDFQGAVDRVKQNYDVSEDLIIDYFAIKEIKAMPKLWQSIIAQYRYEAFLREKDEISIDSGIKEMVAGDFQRIVIPRASVVITTRCTYKCRDCINMIPYYRERKKDLPHLEQCDVPVETVLRDVDGCDEWIMCDLIGGEPFLYSEINMVLDHLISLDKIRNILVGTNGTIIPQKETFERLVDPKITVLITDYHDEKVVGRFVEAMKANHVRYEVREMEWIPPGDGTPRDRSVDELRHQYALCHGGVECKAVFRGNLYACTRSMALRDLDMLESPIDWIPIRPNMQNEIADFYKQDYCLACDQCDLYSESSKRVTAGVQM